MVLGSIEQFWINDAPLLKHPQANVEKQRLFCGKTQGGIMTSKIKQGDYVQVHYTGKFSNGEIFDSSQGCQPLLVQMGAGEVIPGFESALMGMAEKEKKSFTVDSDNGYGPRDESLQRRFNLSDFPEDFQPQVGQVLVLQGPNESRFHAMVREVAGEVVVLDLNHPLAGLDLNFDVEVAAISDELPPSSCGCGCSCS